jgi:hypothetical protein
MDSIHHLICINALYSVHTGAFFARRPMVAFVFFEVVSLEIPIPRTVYSRIISPVAVCALELPLHV